MSSGIKNKFQGSRIMIQIGLDTGAAITGVTQAAPPVVTANGHGLDDGDVAYIDGVLGMRELNKRSFVAVDALANSLELDGVDSTGYGAYASGGTLSKVLFANWCEVTNVNKQGGTSSQLNGTTVCSEAVENVAGLPNSGTLAIDLLFAPSTNIQQMLEQAQIDGRQLAFRIEMPDSATNGVVLMFGTVQQTSFQGGNDSLWTASVSILLSGRTYFLIPE